jgi:hypothetical protein
MSIMFLSVPPIYPSNPFIYSEFPWHVQLSKINGSIFSSSLFLLWALLKQFLDGAHTLADAPEEGTKPKTHALNSDCVYKEVHEAARCQLPGFDTGCAAVV